MEEIKKRLAFIESMEEQDGKDKNDWRRIHFYATLDGVRTSPCKCGKTFGWEDFEESYIHKCA